MANLVSVLLHCGLHKFTAVSKFDGVKLQFPPIQNGRQLSSQYRDYLAIPGKKIQDHTLVIRVSRLISSGLRTQQQANVLVGSEANCSAEQYSMKASTTSSVSPLSLFDTEEVCISMFVYFCFHNLQAGADFSWRIS